MTLTWDYVINNYNVLEYINTAVEHMYDEYDYDNFDLDVDSVLSYIGFVMNNGINEVQFKKNDEILDPSKYYWDIFEYGDKWLNWETDLKCTSNKYKHIIFRNKEGITALINTDFIIKHTNLKEMMLYYININHEKNKTQIAKQVN